MTFSGEVAPSRRRDKLWTILRTSTKPANLIEVATRAPDMWFVIAGLWDFDST